MKHEFASPVWFDALGVALRRAVAADGQPAAFSICEVFTDPPAHLSGAASRIGWHCIVQGGRVSFAAHEVPAGTVACKIVGDYATLLPLARFQKRGAPGEAHAVREVLALGVRAGKISIEGEYPADAEGRLAAARDELARLTL